MADVGSIEVVYADRALDPDAKYFGRSDPLVKVGDIDTDRLAESISRLSRSLDQVFERLAAANGVYELDSLEVSAELTGSGEVRLIGSVGLQVTGGLRLTFRRKNETNSS